MNNTFTPKDVANDFLVNAQWESEHFGFTTIPCDSEQPCSAVFYFDGKLRVFCTNPYCNDKERRLSIPASVIKNLTNEWNKNIE